MSCLTQKIIAQQHRFLYSFMMQNATIRVVFDVIGEVIVWQINREVERNT